MIPGDFQSSVLPRKRLILFGIGGLLAFAGTVLVLVVVISAWLGRPIILGYNDGPQQPIAFPHTVHASVEPLLNADGTPRLDEQGLQMRGLGVDCAFCHRNATEGDTASIPPVALCMTCHLSAGDGKPEVEKLRETFAQGQAIDWVRVHRLPDHVQFIHEAHVTFFSQRDGVAPSAVCATCHGDVAGMSVVKQVRSLKMGDCVNCHRDNGGPTDCTTCHY